MTEILAFGHQHPVVFTILALPVVMTGCALILRLYGRFF